VPERGSDVVDLEADRAGDHDRARLRPGARGHREEPGQVQDAVHRDRPGEGRLDVDLRCGRVDLAVAARIGDRLEDRVARRRAGGEQVSEDGRHVEVLLMERGVEHHLDAAVEGEDVRNREEPRAAAGVRRRCPGRTCRRPRPSRCRRTAGSEGRSRDPPGARPTSAGTRLPRRRRRRGARS